MTANTDYLGAIYDEPMSLNQATRSDMLLVFEPEGENPDVGRPIAHAYVMGDALVYADMGWHLDPPYHPFHVVRGKITGTGPWRIGKSLIRKADHGDPLADFFNTWQERQNKPETRDPDRDACWRAIEKSGILSDETEE